MAGDYVMMKPKAPEEGEPRCGGERSGEPAWKPTAIRAPQQCEHVGTVCTGCLPEWEDDYVMRHNAISANRLGRPYGVVERAGGAPAARVAGEHELAALRWPLAD